MRHPLPLSLLLILLAILPACSEDTEDQNNATPTCLPGERLSPITGACEPTGRDMGRDLGPVRPDMPVTPDMAPDADMPPQPDMPVTPDMAPDADMPPADMPQGMCQAGVDLDGDGLDGACECQIGTNERLADTDGDGLNDGDEVGPGCSIIMGTSDPRRRDTDGDGLSDGEERAAGTNPLLRDTDRDGVEDKAEVASMCMDPLKADTDGDGLPDGVEDGNADGNLGTCAMRVYAPACAQGESDPCKVDTDGDGTPDQDEALYRQCRPEDSQNLTQPLLLQSMPGDYQIALQPGVSSAQATSVQLPTLAAHTFDDVPNGWAGFVVRLPNTTGSADANQLSDDVFSTVLGMPQYMGATRRSSGRQISSHDGYKALVDAVVDLPANTSPSAARDAILGQLTGANDLVPGLSNAIPGVAASPTLFFFEVIARSPQEYIVAGAIAPYATWNDSARPTGWRVNDVVGGTAIAAAGEPLVPDCVSYQVTTRPKVDIIISMDGSGSMGDEQMALQNFTTDLVTLLNGANLDWRVGVVSVSCSNIRNDAALPADFKALFPAGGGFGNSVCPSIPFGGGSQNNGKLEGGNFTTNPATIAQRIAGVSTDASEYTMIMGAAAVARALPRMPNDPAKIREGAAIVVLAVTDEEDDFFKSQYTYPLGSTPLTPAQRAQIDAATQPFIDYLLQPEIAATAFGLYGVPGDNCVTAAEIGSAIHTIVNKTGGTGGSICQADIINSMRSITNAVAGIASGLRLRGAAVAPSLKVKHAQALSGMIVDILRSRANGFDYDAIVNRLAFYGPNPPQTNDRVVIPYLRWQNSVQMCMSALDCPTEQKYQCINGECR
jgi:hypothetical protein